MVNAGQKGTLRPKLQFEQIKFGPHVTEGEFNEAASSLRVDLIETQQALRKSDFPVLIIFAGVDGAGKSELTHLLNEWMDPRWIVTRAYGPRATWQKARPEFWRYWIDLPPKGQVGIYLSAWYSDPLQDRAYRRLSRKKFAHSLDRIAGFEQILAEDGALILKFWMHLDKDAQKTRLETLEDSPEQSWRVTKRDWKNWEHYDKFMEAAEQIIDRTDTDAAPWRIIDGRASLTRSLTVLTQVREAIAHHSKQKSAPSPITNIPERPTATLSSLDLSLTIGRENYETKLPRLRARLNKLYRAAKKKDVAAMLVFEGWDAAGKGGAIRRLVTGLDARDYRIHPFAAPSDSERAQHYLWRFWRQVPRDGKFAIFDRSWYGRVLVERVEAFARDDEWGRAYGEINDFESQLTEHGILLLKFWLHIDKDEQIKRFERRAEIPYKRWKLTDDDWRNHNNREAYIKAVDEMIARTHSSNAPWTLVEANDKKLARLKVIETFCDRLEAAISSSLKSN